MSEDKDIQQEAIIENQGKSDLEQRVSAGIRGGFELKKGEKNRFLGEFKERVLKALTFEQIEEPGTYPEVLEAIKNNEAKKLIINRRVDMDKAKDYIRLAREHDLSFKKVDSPDFKGDIGLVVVSDHAVKQNDILIKNRVTSLKEQGLPIELINAKGEKVCEECYQMIKEKAPEELANYQKMSWLDKIIGKKCPTNH